MTEPSGADAAGTLVVSGAGTTMVATDELLAQAALVRLLHAEAEGWRASLGRIRALDSTPAPGWTAADPGPGVFAAGLAIDGAVARSRALADALVTAAEGYGLAERTAELAARLSGAWVAHTLGRLGPLILAMAAPALAAGAVAWLLGGLASGARPTGAPADVADWLRANPRALTNPALVALVRVIASSVDDAAAGALGVPLPLSVVLGDDGAGLLGVGTSAAGVLALTRPLGLLRETPVTVARVGRAVPAASPTGFGDLAARIPPVSGQSPQVRVERYGDAVHPAWIVYIGGTAEWSPAATQQPWDITSNITAVADQGAGSHRAVVQAMREAGVTPTDPVVQVGHSQGGLIAAQVAASGEFNSVAVVTFGGPTAQVPVPPDAATVAVEHSDDLVPALGGAASATAARLVVRREVYAGAEVPAGPLPAHSLASYRETAGLLDASPEPRLRDFRARLAEITGSAPGEATLWRARRVTPGASPTSPAR